MRMAREALCGPIADEVRSAFRCAQHKKKEDRVKDEARGQFLNTTPQPRKQSASPQKT